MQKVTHCGCWAHARRKWREAMPDGATVKTSKAAVEFRYCTKLFSLEKKYIYADVKARKEYRQNVVLPLLEEYFAWLKSIHLEKGSKLEDAVRYSLNRKQQLMAFLDYGDVPISNNLAENAIGPLWWEERIGCSATVSRERNPVPLCIRWWKRPRPTALSLMGIYCWC